MHSKLLERDEATGTAAAARVPLSRLYVLRVGYLILGVGNAVVKWPLLIHHEPWTLMEGVVNCMLVAFSILAFLGLRYPLQMLPVLLWESAWKLIWLTVVALPLWTADQMDPATLETTTEILWVVLPLVIMPWRYVFAQYVTKHGDRWRLEPSRPATVTSDGVH